VGDLLRSHELHPAGTTVAFTSLSPLDALCQDLERLHKLVAYDLVGLALARSFLQQLRLLEIMGDNMTEPPRKKLRCSVEDGPE
jgi:hypothetical protein